MRLLPLARRSADVPLPTDAKLHALLQTIIARLMKMLTHRDMPVQDNRLPGHA